jgi:hypothetical protein
MIGRLRFACALPFVLTGMLMHFVFEHGLIGLCFWAAKQIDPETFGDL